MQRNQQMDTLQGFMDSFKQFEKKLDKLQDDVKYYGNSLSELKVLVSNLASGVINDKEEQKRRLKGLQYEEGLKTKRQSIIRPLPSKLKTKSLQGPKFGVKIPSEPFAAPMKSSSPTVLAKKRLNDMPRKTTTMRLQNAQKRKLRI